MKHFQLFEQFIYESKLDDNKKALQELDDKIKSQEELLKQADEDYDKENDIYKKWTDGYMEREKDYKGDNYFRDTRDELEKAKAKRDDIGDKIEKGRQELGFLNKDREKLAKEIKKQEQKAANKGATGEDAATSKLRELEDEIESSVDYDFDAYPSSQIKKVMAGGDEAEEIIKKYTGKINDIKAELGDISNAMMDAKDDGDKEQVLQLKLEMELRKAEAELYAAIIKGEPKGLVTPLKKIQKINQKMDQVGSSDD
jgi:uncharacterized protein YfcZ (UPF0381/DUF406 family)